MKFKRTIAAFVAATMMAVGMGGMSAEASQYDSYTYFDQLGVRIYWSGTSEFISLNLGRATGSYGNLSKYRVSVYPHISYPNQTQYQFTTITALCKFKRTDSTTPFTFTKVEGNNTKMPAMLSGDIYNGLSGSEGEHTVTLYRSGYSSSNGTGSVTLYSN